MSDKILMYGADWCGDCVRSKAFFDANHIEYDYIDITDNDEAVAYITELNNGQRRIPTIIYPSGMVQIEPSNAEMAEAINPSKDDKVIVYGATWCPDCRRAKAFFAENNVPFEWIDITDNDEAIAYVEKVNDGNRSIPTIIYPDGTIHVEPSNAEMAAQTGVVEADDHKIYDVVIVGGGPAGLTSAIYTAREGLSTLIVDASSLGGQVAITQVLDNFPGFPVGVTGTEFAERMEDQALRFGVDIVQGEAIDDIIRENDTLTVIGKSGRNFVARSVILSTGSKYRRLNVAGENELIGSNVHFCATCDGAFYKDKDIVVVGGGNSGFEEGLFLADKFAKSVTIVEYMPESKASKILQDKVAQQANMTVVLNHAVQELLINEDGKFDGMLVEDRATGEVVRWTPDGIFVFIGLSPNTGFLPETIARNQWNFITTESNFETSMQGVFAAGDVREGSTKQAVSAAGEGATAAMMVRHYLQNLNNPIPETDEALVAVGD
ncbi:MAG: FAD-dependent oxidoreductase [Phototrophicaceae bacterium]